MKISPERYSNNFRNCVLFTTVTLVLVVLFSCSSTKKVPKGQYLLSNNKVTYVLGSEPKNSGFNIAKIGEEGIEQFEIPQKIAPSEVLPYAKQKPNTKILFIWPFYLELYNLPDSAKAAMKQALRDSAVVEKNRRRIAKGKKPWSQDKLNSKFTPRFLSKSWFMTQGEAPVILDSTLTQKSREQIKSFLFNKGYFEVQVKDSVHKSGKKADVTYILKPGKPYKINNIQFSFEDLGLAPEIYSDTVHCMIRKGDTYDKDNFDKESDRLTLQLNNAGYYFFSKQYVSYTLDSNSKTHRVDVTINLKKFVQRAPDNKDSTVESNHVLYHIRNVTIKMNYDPAVTFYRAGDSMMYDGLKILYPGEQLCLKPAKFRDRIFVTPGDVYRVINREDSYTGLSQLSEFSYINIRYIPLRDSNSVDCIIELMPVVKHSFGTELELTNTGGDGGVQGNISYENYNQFQGAEKLQLKLTGGLIASQLLVGSNTNIDKYIPLNTIDFGPEVDYTVPRPLFPFSLGHFKRRVNPQTTIKLSYNFQQRPDYTRRILGGSYSFDYNPVKGQHFTFTLFEWNFVNADLSQSFAEILQNYNLFLQSSFKNQVITDGRISWLYTNQAAGRQKHFSYLKLNGEFSGLAFDAAEHLGLIHLPVDESGSYYIKQFNGPFSQYLKGDGEYRHYWILDNLQRQKIVVRGLAGWGYAYFNSTELPFTKSFWAGGSNDIRAWNIQTLGPGGSPPSEVVGQIGDIKLEGNFEYRVSLIKYFGIAYFVDAGNIWLMKNKATDGIPRAFMETSGPNPFWSEVAVGTGIGFRLDFNYFVLRFNPGLPLKDPALPSGYRWLDFSESFRRTVYNIGIGYPF